VLEISHELILEKGEYSEVVVDSQSRDIALSCLKFMHRLRKIQLAIMEEYHPANEMRCPVHFCVGQEAVPAALAEIVLPDDSLLSHHRSHGYFLAKGGKSKELFAELYGKATGTNGGMAGSQEISKVELNFFSGAIISGMSAIAVGVAFANDYLGKNDIAFTCHGDGATEEGAFWEAISYASLRKLPVIFICENNRYSTYSPQYKRQAADDIHHRVAAFGLKSFAVFGNDVLTVHKTLQLAVDHVREGSGPVFIEAYTYRKNGHVGPEDDDYIGYRSVQEREAWLANCPIALLEKELFAKSFIDEKEKKAIVEEIDQEIAEAFSFAKDSTFPTIPEDWVSLNCNQESPLADKLLVDGTSGEAFDGNQEEAKLMPY
jgi:pyruvate dehydrogenase E1 component alpha subunit